MERLRSRGRVAALICAAAALPAWFTAGPAAAQSGAAFPSKPLRLLVPNAPGSSNDVLSRLVANRLADALGQQFVVDNRAGAGGVLGVEIAARAAPDGYTLVAASSATHSIAPFVYKKLPYDPVKDFAPISLFVFTQNLLAVNPALPVKSVGDLIALAKAKPGQLNMASAGTSSTSHIAGALFASLAGIDVVHVPYKGAGPSIASVVAGESQFVFTPIAGPIGQVRGGKLRALAVGGRERSGILADVPTVAESGVPSYAFTGWNGFMAPAGTSKAVIDRLFRAMAKVLTSPELREQFAQQGAEPAVSESPEAFGRHVRDEVARYGKLVKAAGIQPE
jgi:tripartite-type tricarboxylate transporter receptor subunit TctC